MIHIFVVSLLMTLMALCQPQRRLLLLLLLLLRRRRQALTCHSI
jgi:hypothetical protein